MSTRVVVPQCLCTTETLQQWVGSQHHVLDLLDTTILPSGYGSDVLHDALRSLRFAGTGLARDNDTLVLMVGVHVVVRRLSDGEDVRGDLKPVLPLVLLKYIVGVDAQIYAARFRNWLSILTGLYAPLNGLTEMSTAPMYV